MNITPSIMRRHTLLVLVVCCARFKIGRLVAIKINNSVLYILAAS